MRLFNRPLPTPAPMVADPPVQHGGGTAPFATVAGPEPPAILNGRYRVMHELAKGESGVVKQVSTASV